VLLFNFRGDRAIEISQAFEDDVFPHFDRAPRPQVRFAGMMQYDGDLHLPRLFLVAPPVIEGTVGDALVAAHKRTFAVAETQKFGHVTYFFNGNRSGRLDPALEDYVEVPSDVRPFDEAPWMKAAEVADAVIGALRSGKYDHIRVNFANPDMVGHTGNLEATRVAVEAVDLMLGRVLRAAEEVDALVLVTADHGNADEMWQHDKKGNPLLGDDGAPLPRTSHTLNAVPFYVFDPLARWDVRHGLVQPGIASIGATVLVALGVPVPAEWEPELTAPREST
jgi:2,3-bisphosphoglycerate-independent phosphoglycerate mutase